ATAPADDNRRAIRDHVAAVLTPFHGDPARSTLVASRGTARRSTERCAIQLGGEPCDPEASAVDRRRHRGAMPPGAADAADHELGIDASHGNELDGSEPVAARF